MSVVQLEDGLGAVQAPQLSAADGAGQDVAADVDDVEESLVEEISIDGMCGVY